MAAQRRDHITSLAATSALVICIFIICEDLVVAESKSTKSEEPQNATCMTEVTDPEPSESVLGNYSNWAITTDAAQCANVSRRIYEKDGNTVDAAIATLLCMGVVIPHSMGIGGGFIATIYNESTKEARVLIARETAPAEANQTMFGKNRTASIWGGLAVAVPGELRGYHELHSKYGKLNWSELFYDAILLAKCGFPIGAHLANALAEGGRIKSALANETRRAFINNETGQVLKEGETLIQEDLAKTLEDVASQGADYFYTGEHAKQLVQKVRDWGGVLTEEDLKNYSATWMTPVNATFQGSYKMYSAPPPGSGPVLSYILGIMDGFRSNEEPCLPDNVTTLHRFAESCKFGYAKRTLLGDMNFVNCSELVKNMTSRDFATEARLKINDSHTFNDPKYYGYEEAPVQKDSGTAHAAFLGSDGVAITVSSTINYYFGSLVRTNSGVLLNNEMDDFSRPGMSNLYKLASSSPNFISPGKRPMSSMAPMILVDSAGKVQLALGGTGGSYITSGIALVTLRALWQGYNVKQAIDKRRLHHQLIPNNLMIEPLFPQADADALRGFGHNVTNKTGRFNVILGIQLLNGRILANSDFRKGGAVDGQ